jgi:glycerol-3-phosphate dehydrogenase subunit C
MRGLSLIRPVEPVQLDKETLRIYEICDGCRRCFNLCPSFNTLLNGIDTHEGDVGKLTPDEHRRIVDECYYCKLCFNHCPYTPPHQFDIDFPHLMILRKQRLASEHGARWRDRWLISTDAIGRIASLAARPFNWLMKQPLVRRVGEAVMGIHRDRHILPFSGDTFPRWFTRRPPPARPAPPLKKVALFSSCLVNYQATDIGKAAVQVLEKNGLEVIVPDQRCCGLASSLGDSGV